MPTSENLCSVDELQLLLNEDTRVLDCSWYLPTQQINTEQAFQHQHIPGAQFFHIDLICDQHSDLPHMLPTPEQFAKEVQKLGIGNDNQVVVYDSAGLFSAARVWWMFRIFGHTKVKVLNGGLPAWIDAGAVLSGTQEKSSESAKFDAHFNEDMLISKSELQENCDSKKFLVLDARSTERFLGQAPEPRPGLPSGHMPESISLPFNQLLEAGKLRSKQELREIFADRGITADTAIVTSCGSGVTAAIITLALAECGFGMQKLYDGSWAEWGSANDTRILNKLNQV